MHCGGGCSALRGRLQCTASEMGKTGTEIVSPILDKRKGRRDTLHMGHSSSPWFIYWASKVLVRVNHDSWNACIVWFGTLSPLTPQCDLSQYADSNYKEWTLTRSHRWHIRQVCSRGTSCMSVLHHTSLFQGTESNCSMIEKMPPKGVSFSDFIATFAMSVGFDTYFDLQH